jgi:phage-related protein
LAQPPPKPIVWIGSSLDDLRSFPEEARNEAGHQLHRVQCGLEPTDWKPMKSIGVGVSEMRIRTGREHRVFFVARFAEAVYVLHAFEKKSAKTARVDLELGVQRLKAVLERRTRRGGGP